MFGLHCKILLSLVTQAVNVGQAWHLQDHTSVGKCSLELEKPVLQLTMVTTRNTRLAFPIRNIIHKKSPIPSGVMHTGFLEF